MKTIIMTILALLSLNILASETYECSRDYEGSKDTMILSISNDEKLATLSSSYSNTQNISEVIIRSKLKLITKTKNFTRVYEGDSNSGDQKFNSGVLVNYTAIITADELGPNTVSLMLFSQTWICWKKR